MGLAARDVARLPARQDFVIRDAFAVTMDPVLGDRTHVDVHVSDGAIASISPARAESPSSSDIPGSGLVALPGFVDTHTHCWNSLFRGLPQDAGSPGYYGWKRLLGPRYTPDDTYVAVQLALAEALSAGITTVHDWAHNVRSPDDADASIAAHRASGLRTRFSYGTPEGIDPEKPMDLHDVRRLRDEVSAAPTENLTSIGVALRGPTRTTREINREEWSEARRLGLPITMHAAGRPEEVATGSFVSKLSDERLLGPDVQLVHALDSSVRDDELMAESGCHLSVSPVSEARLAMGFPRFAEAFAAGIPVSLSTDSVALSGTADMAEVMRMALYVERTRPGGHDIGPRRALELATIEGARDLGLDHVTGSLTPGKRADVILVRLDALNLAPTGDVQSALVHSLKPANVETVIVDGRILKRSGLLTAAEVSRVVADSVAAIRRLGVNPDDLRSGAVPALTAS